jgi:hypothetical protein
MVISLLLWGGYVFGQSTTAIVTVNGLIVTGTEQYGLPGVNVYIPKAGRGTSTNPFGYFSIATRQGDSLVFSAIGYKKQHFIVPNRDDAVISLIINLKDDTTFLPEVEILPYPTEQIFKEAFLALELPVNRNEVNMERNLREQLLARMVFHSEMDGSENFKHYMNQQIVGNQNRYFQQTFSILNPFAWGRFIQSAKRGDLRRKDWQDE